MQVCRILLAMLLILQISLISVVFAQPPIVGDWIVAGTEEYGNQSIILNGNLMIKPGGNLTLNNVTLQINSSYDGEYIINVTRGGAFSVLSSEITAENKSYTYKFVVSGSMEIQQSKVSYMWGRKPNGAGGIQIYSDNVSIIGSLIEYGKTFGVIAYNASPSILNNKIENNYIGIGVGYSSTIIADNNITANSKYGIYCLYSSPIIRNNTITKSYNGVACSYSNPMIANNTITESLDDGVWLEYSNGTIANNLLLSNKDGGIDVIKNSNPIIINNTIRDGNYEGIFVSWYSNPVVLYNSISNYPDGIFSRYFSSPLMTGNKITSNKRSGIRCDSSSPSVINSTILNNYIGVLCSGISNITITDSMVSNSTGYDIYLNQNTNLISLNTTFDKNKVYFNDANSSLSVKWYLDVKVTDDGSNLIPNSTVNIYNLNNKKIYKGATNLNGRIEKIVIEEYRQNLTNVTYYTPHTVVATKEGFQMNATQVVVNSSKSITLLLDPRTIEEYPFVIANGSEIFVSYKKYSGRDWDVYFAKSLDYGNTWFGPVKIVTSVADEVEPIMAVYGSNIYIVYEGNASRNFDIWFTRSADEGASWSIPAKLDPSIKYEGHPYIVVDKLGIIYVTYDGDRGIWSTTSADAGDSWSVPIKISNNTGQEWNPFMATDEFGVYLTYESKESGNSDIWFSKTTDGGNSWSSPVKIDPSSAWEGRPAVAAYNGEIYVTYSATNYSAAQSNYDVKFTKSTDGGITWSTPVKIYDGNASEFRQSVVADANGVYVDYQGTANGNWDIWFTKSVNMGNTWSLPVEVEKTPWNEASPQLTVENGTIYAVSPSYRNNYENVYVWFSRSTDGGATWYTPVKVGV